MSRLEVRSATPVRAGMRGIGHQPNTKTAQAAQGPPFCVASPSALWGGRFSQKAASQELQLAATDRIKVGACAWFALCCAQLLRFQQIQRLNDNSYPISRSRPKMSCCDDLAAQLQRKHCSIDDSETTQATNPLLSIWSDWY